MGNVNHMLLQTIASRCFFGSEKGISCVMCDVSRLCTNKVRDAYMMRYTVKIKQKDNYNITYNTVSN